MLKYNFNYKNLQIIIFVDEKSYQENPFFQINILNPNKSDHTVSSKIPADSTVNILAEANVVAAVESWDQLDAAIESAAKIFANLPVIPE
jgi:hypothetical protein